MRKWFVSLSLACGVCVAANGVYAQGQAEPAQAKPVQVQAVQVQVQPVDAIALRADIAIMPGYNRNQMLQADAIFAGRVVVIEPADVEATQVPGNAKVNYRIAVVQITEAIHGVTKETKQVRIGFVMQPNVNVPPGGGIQIQPVQPGFGPRRPFPGNFQMQLTVGQDGLFTVNKHPKENFYLSPNQQNFVNRENNPGFEGQVKTAKQLAKAMANPVASLKSEDKDERYTAASILIQKYRQPQNPTGQPMKQEPIDAAESKLILQALAGGDWKVGAFNPNMPQPFELFNQLGLQPKDGYTPNFRTQPEMFTTMQKWLDENQGKYVIQKLVVDPNAKAPGVQPGVVPNPGVVPLPIKPRPPIKIKPGVIQPLPAPVPLPAPIEIELPAQPVQPLPPAKRE